MQSRNSLIGDYSEQWVKSLLTPLAKQLGVCAIRGAVCNEIGLSKASPADIAICKSHRQPYNPQDILLIIEVKISIVWNWRYHSHDNALTCEGDQKTHQGNPGLLRSDTMLKAIGKAAGIRMFGGAAAEIPILILGNTPITQSYRRKVGNLKQGGIMQGIWSLNPQVVTADRQSSAGFCQITDEKSLFDNMKAILAGGKRFFSGYQSLECLGRMIDSASQRKSHLDKANNFLNLLQNSVK